jgi:hypothetical protein
LAINVTVAKIGKSLLINTTSKLDKKPSPSEAPNAPSAGKHAAQPIAEAMAPKDPTFSAILESIRTTKL